MLAARAMTGHVLSLTEGPFLSALQARGPAQCSDDSELAVQRSAVLDGHAKALEDQASLPIITPCEMGQPNLDAAVAEIAKFPEYQRAFRKVFGRPPNGTDLVRAIAPIFWRALPARSIKSKAFGN